MKSSHRNIIMNILISIVVLLLLLLLFTCGVKASNTQDSLKVASKEGGIDWIELVSVLLG